MNFLFEKSHFFKNNVSPLFKHPIQNVINLENDFLCFTNQYGSHERLISIHEKQSERITARIRTRFLPKTKHKILLINTGHYYGNP